MTTSRRFAVIALVALVALAACRGTGEAPRASASNATVARLFRTPEHALALEQPDEHVLGARELLDALSAATGWTFVYPGDESWTTWSTGVTAAEARRVPAAGVYTFVESVLAQRNCGLALVSVGEPRLLAVHWLGHDGATRALAAARLVDESELADWCAHPAQLVRVLARVRNAATRDVVRRSEYQPATEPCQQFVVLGDTGTIVIAGLAPWVAAQCDLVRALDRELARIDPSPPDAPRSP